MGNQIFVDSLVHLTELAKAGSIPHQKVLDNCLQWNTDVTPLQVKAWALTWDQKAEALEDCARSMSLSNVAPLTQKQAMADILDDINTELMAYVKPETHRIRKRIVKLLATVLGIPDEE